jgi:hypothetical protein
MSVMLCSELPHRNEDTVWPAPNVASQLTVARAAAVDASAGVAPGDNILDGSPQAARHNTRPRAVSCPRECDTIGLLKDPRWQRKSLCHQLFIMLSWNVDADPNCCVLKMRERSLIFCDAQQ